ncbi:MAG: alpha/beta hydrolase [Acidimicrobiales bacterium]
MIEWVEASDEAVEEMRAVNAAVEQLIAGQPPIEEVGAEATRRARLQGDSWMGPVVTSDDATTRTIETDIGPIDVRVVVPDDPRAVYLHLHGGGFVLGAADQQDLLLSTIAHRCGVAVVSVEYRLAPEHPFPAGPDDCEAAAVWLVDHAATEFGTDRLIIGGESAGAHLATLTLLRLRDRNATVAPFVAANLVFGVFDLSQTPSARNWGERTLILSRATLAWFSDCFAPDRSDEQRRDPALSPLYADLAGLVPALFTVGDQDPLLDDSLFMGVRWRAAGNPAEVLVFPEGPHGFVAFPTAIGTMATDRQLEFIAHHAGS